MTDAAHFHSLAVEQIHKKQPFVAYRQPNVTDNRVFALFQKDGKTHFCSDFSESGFVFAPFSTDQNPFLIPAETSEKVEFHHEASKKVDEDRAEVVVKKGNFPQTEKDQKSYEKLVQHAIDEIKRGEVEKIVLSRAETTEVHDPDPLRIFNNLLDKYPAAFVYLWYHPETGFWLGATPETLLKTERNRFKTMALAGTQLFKDQSVVKWGQKEIEEQKFVTDFITEVLKKTSETGDISVSDPYTLKAGNLLHICTDISGNFQQEKGLRQIVESLHPTPAVCGLPKENARKFILENEAYDREFYTGFLGELNMKTQVQRSRRRKNQENQQFSAVFQASNLYVNLRCMKLKDGLAKIFVGGGVTKDSVAADEWLETVNKAQTMKAVLVK